MRSTRRPSFLPALLVAALSAGCGVSSDRDAELAYRGLDLAVSRALDLGFDGFNAANSANIPTQEGEGDVAGTMTVTGQVDQGVSDNKEMRLDITLEGYQDLADVDEDAAIVALVYDTGEHPAASLDVSLRDIPDGTLDGVLLGTFELSGDLTGAVTLDLALAGPIEDDGTGGVQRVDGSTQVVGTATNAEGAVFEIDLTR